MILGQVDVHSCGSPCLCLTTSGSFAVHRFRGLHSTVSLQCLIGNKYSVVPLPESIQATQFEDIKNKASERGKGERAFHPRTAIVGVRVHMVLLGLHALLSEPVAWQHPKTEE